MADLDYEPFCPNIQRLDRSFHGMRLAALAVILGLGFWTFEGRALYRRLVIGLAGVPEAQRVAQGFVAIAFPRVTKDGERFTISAADLEETLTSLRRLGWVTIGLKDIEDFYERDRPLPPKALLLAFDRDNAETIQLADAVLKKTRMRALLFLNKTPPDDPKVKFVSPLTPHAITQLLKTGAWEMGVVAEHEPHWERGDPIRPAVLDLGEEKYEWTRNPYRFPVRFIASRGGYNDAGRMPWALHLFRVRGDRAPADVVKVVSASLPRTRAFADDFQKDGLGLDWIAERGVVVVIGKRMVLVPTPKQKTASAYLSGTDAWSDVVVEWELKKYRKDAWLYARGSEKDDRWVRVGALNGYWYVQQKVGGEKKLVTLGRAPMTIATSLPARVRLVLKGPWAIVHVNGRMQYNKALRVHTGIDRGRVEFDVYDEKPAAALSVIGSFAAAPLSAHWLSFSHEAIAANSVAEQALIDGVREHAVYASVLSPRWLDVLADGRIAPADDDRLLVRSLAGYYRCLLVPMVDFAAPNARLPQDRAAADRMIDQVVASLAGSEAVGLNLRLSASRAGRAETEYFLSHLRERLHAGKWRLYITLDGSAHDAPWLRQADGVLRATSQPVPGASVLESFDPGRGKPGSA